jgi:hypothetical protein
MAIETPTATSEVAILSRVFQPNNGTLSAAAARAWLKLDFADEDRARMHELAVKAQEGMLSAEDEVALNNYRRAGCLLDMMHSKARHSLKKRGIRA